MTATLRVLPVPRTEPPYDDELPDGPPPTMRAPGPTQGTLALSFTLPSGLPAVPETPGLRLVPPLADYDDEEAAFGPSRTPRTALPDPRRWAGRLAQAVVEVSAGDRPVGQLVRWTSKDVYADLDRRVTLLARQAASRRRAGRRAVVRSIRVCEPADGVAEASALVHSDGRTRALAMRLEGMDGRWRCTALEVG